MQVDLGQRWMQGAASAALAIGVTVALTTWAEAACNPASGSATPGTTVTCDNTTNQDGVSGYGTSNETGITINVVPGATLEGTAQYGIWVGDAVVNNGVGSSILGSLNGIVARTGSLVITNAGTISTTHINNGSYAIYASTGITLTNEATGSIYGKSLGVWSALGNVTADNAGAINGGSGAALRGAAVSLTNRAGGFVTSVTNVINSSVGGITIDNSGTIDATGGTALRGQGDIAVTNRAGGVISATQRAIYSLTGSVVLDNAGSITAINDWLISGNNVTVTNRAGGSLTGTGPASGIQAFGNLVLHNEGNIAANVTGANVTVVNTATGTIGAVGGAGTVDITNAGIMGGAGGAAGRVLNLAGGVIRNDTYGVGANGDVSIVNYGTIAGTAGVPTSNGMLARDRAQVINHVGATISGETAGIVVDLASTAVSIFNAGTISSPFYAVAFGGSGSSLTLASTSVISGIVYNFAAGNALQLGGTETGSFDISKLGQDASNQYINFTAFNKVDSSLWSVTGNSTYNGAVNVNGGTLAVNGNLAAASLLTVNAGGTLGGNGTLGATVINGGTLAPGNSIGTITMASLTMTAASTYLVETSGTQSDKTNVTGAATLAGKVVVNPLTRLTSTTTYTIINAGTLTGTFDSASVTSNFARNARLTYVGNDVLLTLDPGLLTPILPGNASINNRNVAAGIDNALERGAALTPSFNALFGLTGNNLLNGLTQISGETVTGSQQATFDAMTQFMGVMSDPFTVGRGGTAPAMFAFSEDSALAYAPDGRKRTRAERDAFAMFTKAPPKAYEARWNVWAAGFGGSRTTDGNTVLGSNRTTGNVGAAAVGADYWFSPETVAGFALAGGGTSFSVANGGSGQSDLFQAGAFIRHTFASSYITATAAYGWQDIRTDRLITAVGTERLRADFNANAFSARIEAGNRWVMPELGGIGLTPYAAAQVIAFHLPAYAETSLNGAGGFALNYSAETATATRTELGLRGDKSWAMAEGLLTIRGRAAWAHDYNSDRNVSAVFQSLPGSTFIVNGAQLARNAALTSASAEMNFNGGWSVAATFDGEFSDVTRSYAGKGVVRYAW